jgi:hypothetical protein
MQRLAQNVTGIKVPLSGHWIPEEQPDFVVKMLNNFFGGSSITTTTSSANTPLSDETTVS